MEIQIFVGWDGVHVDSSYTFPKTACTLDVSVSSTGDGSRFALVYPLPVNESMDGS